MSPRLSRRRLLELLAGGSGPLIAGRAAGGTTPAKRVSGGWRQHGASGANTNRTADMGPQLNQHTDWTIQIPSADTAPLVADDTVIVLDLSSGQIHGRHAATGTERFTVALDFPVVSGVLGADARRVYTAEVVSPRVHAFSIPEGRHVWQTALDESGELALGISGGFRTEPRLQGGTLYLKSRSTGPQGGGVVALDAATGAVDGVFPGTFSAFAVDSSRLIGARGGPSLTEHGLVSLDTGRRHWTYETQGRPGSPTIGSGLVYVGTSENEIHAVDTDGEAAWTAPVDGWAVSLALGEQTLLAQTEETLVAFDAATGQRRWEAEAGLTRPVVAHDVVYVGREGGFDGYALTDGELAVSYRHGRRDSQFTHLSVAGESLFATAPGGVVLAVTQRIRWRSLLDG